MSTTSSTPKKELRLFDLTMIVVSFVIGMGIFKTPSIVAAAAVTPFIFFIAWVIGGFIALSGALTYAEIGSRYPVTGGYYKIFSKCYHPSIAFAISCIILVSNAASVAAVALLGAEYIGNVALEAGTNTAVAKMWIAGICILLFYGVNLLGLKMSSMTQNILMIFKIGLLLMMISALFVAPNANINAPIASTMDWADIGRALGICLVAVTFTYGGIQQTMNMGGDVKNASRIMPRSIILGVTMILVLYFLTNFAYYRVIGFEQLATTESIAAVMASHLFGDAGYKIVSWLFFFSVLGYVNVMLIANPRVLFAMSGEGTIPASFSRVNPKTGVMTFGLTVFTILSIFTLFFAKEFDVILNYIMFLDSIGMATSAATIFILRHKNVQPEPEIFHKPGMSETLKDEPVEYIKNKIYKVPLYPILPIFYILAYIFIAISVYVKDPSAGWYGIAIFFVFFGIYWIVDFFKKKTA
jgi:APA family basic amino acid/polyamine antiporter